MMSERQRAILWFVYSNRFADAESIRRYFGGSRRRVTADLQELRERQFIYLAEQFAVIKLKDGFRHFIYGLDTKGARYLQDEGVPLKERYWRRKNRDISAAKVCEQVLVARARSVLPKRTLFDLPESSWPVEAPGKTLFPDHALGYEIPQGELHLFIEAYKTRRDFKQLYRAKFQHYQGYYERQRAGGDPPQALFVLNIFWHSKNMQRIAKLAQENGASPILLFSSLEKLDEGRPWLSPATGRWSTLSIPGA